MRNPADVARAERDEIARDKSGVPSANAENFRSAVNRAPCHRANRGVHPRRIASAG